MAWRAVTYRAVRPLLFTLDAERIHHLTIAALRFAGENPIGRGVTGWMGGASPLDERVEVAGLQFRSRIGVGAGFDKDAVALRGWAALGLGFAEVGTATPLPQAGNPRPRLFRLAQDEALINRMGFNNSGAEAVARNISRVQQHLPSGFVVGVNIGRNASTPPGDAVRDYLAAHRQLAPHADYLTVNVSSPNTPGLRDLQAPRRLRELLTALADAGEQLGCARPIFVKLAPDLHPGDMEAVLAVMLETPARGVILANTTIARERLTSPGELAREAGGLSGAPLLVQTRGLVRRARALVGDRLAIIASGGIGSAEDAAVLLDAGADLLQLWTGMVFRGPGLIGEVTRAAGTLDAG
ncbi:MAG: quinone-dependent dihydroorotate dehydrogenase [Chloroflexota bacterium]|nr:quinone-dependent dihydroorotate dehydrogenase [Chloroflexota bacterium]